MRKMIFLCVGNVILSLLFGLAFLYPVSEVYHEEGVMLGGAVSVFPLLLLGYLVLYPLTCLILKKRFNWGAAADSELAFSDEREKVIVSEAAKTAYQILFGGIIVIIAAIGGVRLFSLFTGMNISIYMTSVLLLTMLLIAAMVSYCVRWCVEYRK